MRAQIAVAVALAVALAAPVSAAPKPQITDPAGDALLAGGYDIVSALFSTTGTTVKVGRKTVYTPTKLLVTVRYNATVPADAYAAQVVTFNAPGCDNIYLETYTGGTYGTANCLEESFTFSAKPSGKTVTFSLPFSIIGKATLKKGARLTALRTYTAIADPVVGYETGEFTMGQAAVDSATTDAAYKIS